MQTLQSGDRVKFLPRSKLIENFLRVIPYERNLSYQCYLEGILWYANKTFYIDRVFHDGRFTIIEKNLDPLSHQWIFYPQFVTLIEKNELINNSIPDLLGNMVYER